MRSRVLVLLLLAACSTARDRLPAQVGAMGGAAPGAGGSGGGDSGAGATPASDAPVDRPAPTPEVPAAETAGAAMDTPRADAPAAVDLGRSGTPCTSGPQCGSGYCADGVCCNVACDGVCTSCTTADRVGTCISVLNGNDTPACLGADKVCVGGGQCAVVEQQLGAPGTCTRKLYAVAQGFTVERGGRLVGFRADVRGCTSSFMYMKLHEVVGTTLGPSLISTPVTKAELESQAGKFPLFWLATARAVTPGQKLAFSISGECDFRLACGGGGAFTGGISWSGVYSEASNDEVWTARPEDDLVFETLVLP